MADATPLQSPLHDRHEALGAKFSEFGGWLMPLEYPTGVVKEHAAVRDGVGIFDVSHLGKLVVRGPGAVDFLNATLTNDLHRIGPGKAQYSLVVDDATGGIVDDVFTYYRDDEHVLVVPNASNNEEVRRRLVEAAPEGIEILDHHRDYVVLAVQGAKSDEVVAAVGLPVGHEYLTFVETPWEAADADADPDARIIVCRTGYTGERGYELIAPSAVAPALWDALMEKGAEHGLVPAGLGARDTLRTEMGYPLHGQDIGPDITPVEARLGWAVGWKKDAFWGRDKLLAEKEAGPRRKLVGLVSTGRAIPRPHMSVRLLKDVPLGEVTSGTFSPTLKKGIALALVSTVVADDAEVTVDVRGRAEVFQVTKPPFVQPSVRES
ncbi:MULTISPECIES: glycine cleavage system aminomethyltransferase GcvT [unclassified Nocardioides]|uniref:glycine cleavage system aminomethyltransferase GcvT n=1 Tax=unclassified Nocardioides TaxID=2615069 RepID=UPI00070371EC|nr:MULTISPECIES: glycine cleavage system aminomethyltransferase GcvT [unclassified Nocardioides]KRC48920.1 glycine cleavage system protein T [Nocardioides sp. Root79]KRC75319.1 glycine cleavage system protein T [Nocardioides sp. Root240]